MGGKQVRGKVGATGRVLKQIDILTCKDLKNDELDEGWENHDASRNDNKYWGGVEEEERNTNDIWG